MTDRAELVLLSGGLDSATLLARHAGTAGLAVSVDYGQRHVRELDAASRIAAYYEVEQIVLDLSEWGTLLTGSSLTDLSVDVPHGHYAAPSMAATIVPNRNATLLMAAAGIAVARGLSTVLFAAHSGDHWIYPDCRRNFIAAIDRAVQLATECAVSICAPFVHITKTDVARLAGELGVPIGLTWSCYEGGAVHCGLCGTCTERREALVEASVPDPTEYEG